MPLAAGFDPSSVAQDKDFRAAPTAQQIAYLSSQDQDFARAAPEDQRGYIAHLLGVKNIQPVTPKFNEPPPPPGFMSNAINELGGAAKGIAGRVAGSIPGAELIPQGTRQSLGITTPADVVQGQVSQLQQVPQHFKEQTAAGYSLPYRALTPLAEGVGVNVRGMEQSAKQGDVGGVAGRAATEAALAASPLAAEGGLRLANRVLPSTVRAGTGLSMLTDSPQGAFAQHPLETPKAFETANKIESELQITGERPHPIVQNYLANEQLRNTPPEIADQMRAQGIDPNNPMTLYEARTTLKRVNDIIRNSKGFGADAAAKTAITNLKRFAGALDEDISNAANQYGFGKDYEAMRNEYKRGQQIIRGAEEIGAPAGALAGYAAGREIGEPIGGTLIGGAIGRHVGKYTTGAAARALVERQAGPPTLRSIPPTPEAYTRTILEAKEGRITPQEANRRIQKAGGSVRVRPLPTQP